MMLYAIGIDSKLFSIYENVLCNEQNDKSLIEERNS